MRRACQPTTSYCESGYTYGSPQGYYSSGQGGYGTTGGGYYGGGYPGGTAGYPGGYGYSQPGSGYDFGRPGYNPGGLGGPASGIGVRPGLGAGGFGPGADRPQVLRSPCGVASAWTYRLTRGGGGGQLIGRRGLPVRRLELQPVRLGVTPEATRPLDPVGPPNRRGPSEAVPVAIPLKPRSLPEPRHDSARS